MRKKIYATAVSLLIAFTSFAPATAAQLTDISGNWAQKEIQYFVDQGIIVGYEDGTFHPESPVTRAEFVRIVNNAYKFNTPAPIAFTDVHQGDWFYNDVSFAVAAGFISGYADNTFRPQNNITRQEVASIIQRILKLPANTTYAPSTFNDVPSTSHYNGAIGALTSAGVMKGTSAGLFSPTSSETRADTAYSLYNSLNYGITENTIVNGNVIVRERSYGPASEYNKETVPGNLNVKSTHSETVVRNVTVQGDFTIEDTAKQVLLENVTVKGKLIVNGGTRLEFNKSDVQNMDVNNSRENMTIWVSKDSICYNVNVYTNCSLTEDSEALSFGFSNVVINRNSSLDLNPSVSLSGHFVAVDVYPPSTTVSLTSGQISDLYFDTAAVYSKADLKSGTRVDNTEIKAENVTITGTGLIYSAKIDAANVTLNTVPQALTGSFAPKYSTNVENNNLFITVVNRNNVPVASANVTVSGTTKTTGTDGKVTFANTPMGSHNYSVEKTGYTSVSGTINVTDYTTTRIITLASTSSHSLTFTVVDNSNSSAVSSALVELKSVSSSSTSSSGTVTFSGLDNGAYSYTVTKSGYTTASGTVTINGSNAASTVRLVPTTSTYDVEFYVRNASSLPLSGAKIVVTSTKTATTNSSGYAIIKGLSYGSHSYTVTATGYNSYSGTMNITGGMAQNVQLTADSYTVTVNVKDYSGIAIADAEVTLSGTAYTSTALKTDQSGSVSFAGVPSGAYSVAVSKSPGYVAHSETIDVYDSNFTLGVSLIDAP